MRTKRLALAAAIALAAGSTFAAPQPPAAGQPATPQAPPTVRNIAPIDLTGYWVSVVTEDWRWRMLTPRKGDYASLPLNEEGRRAADSWDLARDETSGLACKPFGVGGVIRMPGRLHITWQDDTTLKVEFDAGTQTRLLHFAGSPPDLGGKTWQGYSSATWEIAGQQVAVDRNGLPIAGGRGRGAAGRGAAPRGGSLRVVTTGFREGYLRKNGVPYSADASIVEYFDRVGPEPNGDVILLVRTVVEDPKYLNQPFITSTNFKLEKDGSKWNPTPCKIDPPIEPGK